MSMNYSEIKTKWKSLSFDQQNDIFNEIGALEYDLIKQYDEMLDEIYGNVNLGGYEYSHSQAFKVVDSIAYRESFLNWIDSEGWLQLDDDFYQEIELIEIINNRE